jgi:hypothetical protein
MPRVIGATEAILIGVLAVQLAAPHYVRAESAGDKVAPLLPPSVSVLGRKLDLKHQEGSPTAELLAEYVPAAETLDHWTLMLAVRISKGKLTPDQALRMKEQEVDARRAQGDFMANSASFVKGELRVIDFVMSQAPIVEHNVMNFSKGRDGRLVSYQLARRYYRPSSEVDDGLRAFMGEIKTNRDTYVQEIERLSRDFLK